MKISKYTFFFDIENTDFYAYNTLSNALIEIDQESYNILHNRIQDEDLSEMLFDNDLWNALVTNNILTDNNEDDFLKYSFYYENEEPANRNAFNACPNYGLLFPLPLLF